MFPARARSASGPRCNEHRERRAHAAVDDPGVRRATDPAPGDARRAGKWPDATAPMCTLGALRRAVSRAIRRARANARAVAVCCVRLDGFDALESRFGRLASSALLRQFSASRQRTLPSNHHCARVSPDTFVVFVEAEGGPDLEAKFEAVTRRLRESMAQPLAFLRRPLPTLVARTGVALYPTHGGDARALLQRAIVAARESGADERRAPPAPGRGDVAAAPRARLLGATTLEWSMLLERARPHLDAAAGQFVQHVDAQLATRNGPDSVLSTLSPDEHAARRATQEAHLRFLLAPGTSTEDITREARAIGIRHALTGVSAAWLTHAMVTYRDLLRHALGATPLAAHERALVMQCAETRLQCDLQAELDTMHDIADAYNAFVARPAGTAGLPWTETLQAELDACARLPGIRACQWFRGRTDTTAMTPEFILELSSGAQSEADIPATCWPAVRDAWISGDIQAVECAARDDAAAATEHPRSLVAIPVRAHREIDAIAVLLGAYPHQFASNAARTFVTSLQNQLNHLASTSHSPHPPIERKHALQMRSLLYADGLRMVFQPIFDLESGKIRKIEALARLDSGSGAPLISPDHFLPAFRQADLDALFRAGLRQSLDALSRLKDDTIDVDLSVNVAPATLQNAACASWIEEIIRNSGVAPHHVVLELLESQEFDAHEHSAAIQRIADLGVKLAIDDLGSGYSSLHRLATMPFDVIKVDQSILREIQRAPLKTFSLIRTMVEFGRDFNKDVIVEGVEDEATIEAVRILGVRLAQGYAICRPVALPELIARARLPLQPQAPDLPVQTHLGALAFSWKFRHASAYRMRSDACACPLHRFLARHGLEGSPADRLHRASHGAAQPEQREQASRALRDWLLAEVTRRAQRGATPVEQEHHGLEI